MTRREFLGLAALASGMALLPTAHAQSGLATAMTHATQRFLEALSATQRQQAVFAFSSSERTRWHWTNINAVPRNGLALADMTAHQRLLALALLRSSLSETGYKQAIAIMALQLELGASELEFYISVFGTPGTSPRGWRIEGHHLSRHFTVRGEVVGVTPFFLGSYPTETGNNLRAMPREEDVARALVRSLNASQRSQAVFDSRRLTAHVTQNAVKVSPLAPIGLEWAALNPAQQKLLEEILQTFLKSLPQNLLEAHWQKLKTSQTSLRFAWSGAFEPRNPHHYRIQGQGFLLEYDNTRNSGTHIHSVWRDFSADFEALA